MQSTAPIHFPADTTVVLMRQGEYGFPDADSGEGRGPGQADIIHALGTIGVVRRIEWAMPMGGSVRDAVVLRAEFANKEDADRCVDGKVLVVGDVKFSVRAGKRQPAQPKKMRAIPLPMPFATPLPTPTPMLRPFATPTPMLRPFATPMPMPFATPLPTPPMLRPFATPMPMPFATPLPEPSGSGQSAHVKAIMAELADDFAVYVMKAAARGIQVDYSVTEFVEFVSLELENMLCRQAAA